MTWRRIGKALLFPHMAVLLILLPAGTGALVCGFLFLEETDPVRIASYVLAFYTLSVWCLRFPALVRSLRRFRDENPWAQRWLHDTRLRVRVTLTGNVIWNSAYGLLQLGLGMYHRSFWFLSLAGYYFSLAVMRFFLVRHTARHRPGAEMRKELCRYRTCGWVFLLTNLALSAMILCMIRENRMVRHHEITTIAMAAYTFASLAVAIFHVIRYRAYQSPVFSASKAISLAAACVSMLTLEGTMLATFSGGALTLWMQRQLLGCTGGAVSLFIVAMAIFMIVRANQNLNRLENENGTQGNL